HQERRQQYEQEADAVDADVVAHAERRHPWHVLLELIADELGVESSVERQRQQERDDRDREGGGPQHSIGAPRYQQERQAGQTGQEGAERARGDKARETRKTRGAAAPASIVSA